MPEDRSDDAAHGFPVVPAIAPQAPQAPKAGASGLASSPLVPASEVGAAPQGKVAPFFIGLGVGAALVAAGVFLGLRSGPSEVEAAPAAAPSAVPPPFRETTFINFDQESTRQEILGAGWGRVAPGAAEDSLHWCEAKSCSLEIESLGGDPRLVRIRWAPFHFPDSPPQKVAVSLNGAPIGAVELPQGFTISSFEAKASLWKRGENELKFDFAYAKAPKDVSADNPDPRTLSALFDWIEIVRR